VSTEKLRECDFFSERLKTLRKDSNKAEFSRFLGIPAPMYHRYEQGQIPKEGNLRVIANRCGVTIDWLLGRDDSPPQTISAELHHRGVVKLQKGHKTAKGSTSPQGCCEVAKGSESGKGSTSAQGCAEVAKGSTPAVCRYPEACDLGGELAAVRERMAEVESTLSHMSIQLETVVGLLGSALGNGMKRTRPREADENGDARKAG
jgi:transcriptional regulator with XRE-family HTH domain